MGSEATCPFGGDDPLFLFTTGSPLDIQTLFTQIPVEVDCHMEDYLLLDGGFAGDASHSTTAGQRQAVQYPLGLAGATAATGAEDQHEQNAHAWFDWKGTSCPPATYSVGSPGRFTGTGTAAWMSWSPLLGLDMREINAVLSCTGVVVLDPRQEPTTLVVNAGLAVPAPDPYSAGHTSWSTCTTAADTGSSSLDQAEGLLGFGRSDPIHAPAGYSSSPLLQRALPHLPRKRRPSPATAIHAAGAIESSQSSVSVAAAAELRRDPTMPAAAASLFPSPPPTPAAAMATLVSEPPRSRPPPPLPGRPHRDLVRPPPGSLTARPPSPPSSFPASHETLSSKPAEDGDERGREQPEIETREKRRCGGAVSRRGLPHCGLRRGQRAPAKKKNSARSPSVGTRLCSDGKISVEAGLPQSGGSGSALTEAPVQEPSKRKKIVCGSSSQRSSSEFNSAELQSNTTDISTPFKIIQFLREGGNKMGEIHGEKVNRSLAEEDEIAPKTVRSYVTTVQMMADQKPHDHLGCWKEKQVENVEDESLSTLGWVRCYAGLKKTFQFQTSDGTKTNWFMDEYIATNIWGFDLYMESLRFRVVYKSAEVPGEPTTSPQVNKIAALKHRIREPENLVIKGESPAWQHLIKVYDRHPELEGSKVVYAVCYHCGGVLKAGTENGTKSLLTHCNRTCPIKNKNQQPRSSRE